MEAVSLAGQIWWWIGLGVTFLVVIPLVLFLVGQVLTRINEIKSYTDDVLEHGVATTKNLEPVPALSETGELVKRVSGKLAGYAGAIDRMP